jgi:hypothetical protein
MGCAKDATVVSLGVMFFHDAVTWLQVYGYAVSLIGFAWFNVIKSRQHATAGATTGSTAAQHKDCSAAGHSTSDAAFSSGAADLPPRPMRREGSMLFKRISHRGACDDVWDDDA